MKPDEGVEISIGGVRLRVESQGQVLTPQRTESLARELMRGLLGSGAAPALEVVRGPAAGARRELPPPEATVIVGRGDEATWVILDEDLSRQHAEIVRGWDGVTIRDLGSKNGTRVGGVRVAGETRLADGARIELGGTELVFIDPAERHLQGESATVRPAPVPVAAPGAERGEPPRSRGVFVAATAICGIATAALIWVLAS